MSTQNWITVTPLGGGLRIIRGWANVVLDANSEAVINVGNCERVLWALDISNVNGFPINIDDCRWLEKQPPAIAEAPPVLMPNSIIIVVRCGSATCTPHGLAAAYTNIDRVWFTLIVH